MLYLDKRDSIYPQFINQQKGGRATFKCSSDLPIQWFHSSWQRVTELNELNQHLSIYNVQSNNTGYYYCYGLYGKGRTFISEARLSLLGMYLFELL